MLATTIQSPPWQAHAIFQPVALTRTPATIPPQPIATTGLAIIVVSAIWAALGLSADHFYGSLIILGIGWNFGFVGSTAMLDAAALEDEKAAVQGANETIIATLSTVSAFAAGAVLSSAGWTFLALMSGGLVFAILLLLLIDRAMITKA